MRKRCIIIAILFSFLTSETKACEICGCGVGNYYIGILPQFKSRFIGLRYHFNKFSTRLTDDPTQYSKDFFQTAEVWSGWNIGKRFQLLTLIPVNFNHQISDEGISNVNGLGDVVLMMNYKLFDFTTKTANGKNIFQQGWIGGGVKLPTGEFVVEDNNPDMASMTNIQSGSGSTDFLVNGMYNMQVQKWGITTQVNYKINTANRDEFKFGNKFSASSFVSYSLNAGKTTISPNVGLMYENAEASKSASAKVDLTGGTLLQSSLGVEFGLNKITFGVNARLPVTQDFAENQTKQKIKGMAHISFSF